MEKQFYWRIAKAMLINGVWEGYDIVQTSEDLNGQCVSGPDTKSIREQALKEFQKYEGKPGHYILEFYTINEDHIRVREWSLAESHTQLEHKDWKGDGCAYDGFGNELHVGDKVLVAVSRWTGDYILYKGIVRGWSNKTVKVECYTGATNSDKPAGMEYSKIIGKITNRKPDKLCKIIE